MFKLVALLGYSIAITSCAASQPPPTNAQEAAEPKAGESAEASSAKEKTKGPVADHLAGAHILIAYKGAQRASASVVRSQAEALALATRLAVEFAKLDAKDPATVAKFAAAAREHSDCPSAARGGKLGTWRRGRMAPAFDEATLELGFEEISGVVKTPFGYHVIRRLAIPVQYAASQILIAYEGAKRAVVKQRTRAQALALAKTLSKQLQADPRLFFRAAQVNSDDSSGPRGGKLGILSKGMLPPAVEASLAKLKIRQVSDPIETPFGFHIILRDRP